MKVHMNSIQTKFIILTMAVVLLSAGVVGGTSVLYTVRSTDKSTAKIMNSICREKGADLDGLFLRTEQTLQPVVNYALQKANLGQYLQTQKQRADYLEEMKPLFRATAEAAEEAVGVYLRLFIDSEATDAELVYRRSNKEEEFYLEPPSREKEREEWYSQWEMQGKPVWMAPYDNGKTEGKVISCVIPLCQEEKLLGIVGIDILFEDIAKEINSIQVYDTGYAFLADGNDEVVYHSSGKVVDTVEFNRQEWDIFVKELEEEGQQENVFQYEFEGQKMKITCCSLNNGMRLIVAVPTAETDRQGIELTKSILLSVVVISIICVLITVTYTQSIVRPLKELTKASKQVAEGNMNVTLLNQSQDEVGELASSFQQTVDCLRVYMDRMNDLAYRDSLTGVKSKTAYDEEMCKVNSGIKMGFDQFGILMLDINGLKGVNDQFGHEAGNRYIINCCKLICNTFKHSPVFRIGGDEFVVLLIGDDLTHIEELLKKFDERMEEKKTNTRSPEERVSVAAGLAVYDRTRDASYEDVFKRADAAMYQKKGLMKQTNR